MAISPLPAHGATWDTWAADIDAAVRAGGSSASSTGIPALEGVPLSVYGHSYGAGAQGADQASRPADRIYRRQRTQTLINHANAGHRMDQIATIVAANWVPNSRGLIVFEDGVINDERAYGDLTGTPTTREAFRTALVYLTSVNVTTQSGSAFAYGSGWTAGASSTVGSTADVAFTGDTAYLLVGYGTSGGTITITDNSGSLLKTVNTGGYKQAFTGSVKIAGQGAGTHSLRIALTAGSVTLIGIAVPAATPPFIAWDKAGRTGVNGTEAALLASYQAECATILTDFPTVVPVDMGSGWDYTTMISGDGTHRNDRGNAFATARIETELANRLGSTYVQGLNSINSGANPTTAAPAYTVPSPNYTYSTPGAPTALTITATPGDSQVTITASGGTGATSFALYRNNTATGSPIATSFPFTDTGRTNGTPVTYIATATNATGTVTSSSVTVTPAATPTAPAQVTGLTATSGAGQVTLSWTAPSNGGSAITDYVVQSRTTAGPGAWATFADGTSTATSATVTGLSGGTSYDFQVAAVNAIGTGTYSATATATPSAPPVYIVADDFNRADSALTTTPTGGKTYVVVGGVASVVSNQLAWTTVDVVGAGCTVSVDPGVTDYTVSTSVKSASGGVGVIARASDALGYMFWRSGTTAYRFSKRNGSSNYTTVQDTTGITPAVGDVISISVTGSSIVCKVNGVTAITTTDATYTTGRGGLWSQNTSGRLDDFTIV